MKYLLVFTTLAITAFAVPFKFSKQFSIDDRIVGGEKIDISKVPWQVSLQHRGSHYCGAAIISEKYLVTAGHCTDGVSAKHLTIRAGSNQHKTGGIVVQVAAYHQHPKYQIYVSFDWDISTVELASPLSFNEKIKPAALPSLNEIWAPGSEIYVSGWGSLGSWDPNNEDDLKGVTIYVVSNEDCYNAYQPDNKITDNMLCAADTKKWNKGSCQGDSGGPLTIGNTLVGVVSWGRGCGAVGYPEVATNISAYREFIQETTGL